MLLACDIADEFALYVERSLLQFFLNTLTDCSQTDCVFVQYVEGASAPDQVDEELRSVCLRWSSSDVKNHSAVAKKGLDTKIELKVGK